MHRLTPGEYAAIVEEIQAMNAAQGGGGEVDDTEQVPDYAQRLDWSG